MLICVDCGSLFDEPKLFIETLDDYCNQIYHGCPHCSGDYMETCRCDNCEEWIKEDYIKVGNQRFCSDCCEHYYLGEEDI